jgi:hypothetical protein
MKNRFCSSTTLSGSATPFVISTEASAVERSLFGCSFLEMFSTERTRIFYFALLATTSYAVSGNRMQFIDATDLMGERSGGTCFFFPSRNHSNLSHPSPLVIPTEAQRSGGICSAPCRSLKSFLVRDAG